MNRRQAVKQATLLAFGMALGKMDVMHAEGGLLTVDLSQWGAVQFKHKGQVVNVPVAEVFAALKRRVMGIVNPFGPKDPTAGGQVIGQPTIIEGFITLSVKCTCGQVNMVVGPPGAIKQCVNQECDWAFMIGPQHMMRPDGMAWSIAWNRWKKGEPMPTPGVGL